ncbi:helix-turn-helix domain-containing protein [Nitrosomonas sp.]|uniref:helix-turn-helix domain-containing protein n=1 Tax=Nitrosomonas sp. TaxID=42353 RepID=UPI001D25C1A7|nr:helix-turn-helix domain-containing protein [Nitrosomonas sp.]MBX3617477.1 helix-turn-helix domain-containing protein [Nitrosomonas sp.]
MTQFLSVSDVADFLEVSERRVRTLLSQGRIDGYRDDSNVWRIACPLNIKPGKRGPDLRSYAVRKLQPRQFKVVGK